MNAIGRAKLYRDFGGLHPTMIAAHIAAVSNVQKSPRKSPIYWRFWRRLLAGFAR